MIDLKPLPMEDAIRYWMDKYLLSPGRYAQLSDEAKVRAFAVSGIAKGEELETVFNALQRALKEGTTFEDFKRDAAAVFERRGWTGKAAWRVETIFRTNIQTAYSVGRYKEMMAVVKDRPYWQYSAVNDSRTRPTHAALNGKVFPADHPFWNTWYPPNGFNCRCGVVSLSQDDVDTEKLPVETEDPTGGLIEPVDSVTGNKMPARPLMPDQGFDHNPGKAAWETDTLAYDRSTEWSEALQEIFLADMAGASIYQETFPSWVDEVRASGTERGITKTVGWVDGKIIERLKRREIELETPVIVIDDKKLIHAIRDVKASRGVALTIEQIKQVPSYIAKYEAVLWDTRDPALLYVTSDKDKKIKLVVRVNYKLKGAQERVNLVVTTGKVNVSDLKVERYSLLDGNL